MGGTLDDGSISGRANAMTNRSPAPCMTGGIRRDTSGSTAAYTTRSNKTAQALVAMKTKSTCERSDRAGTGRATLVASGAVVMAGPGGATTGATGATTGAANATAGAYASGMRLTLTGLVATHTCHCVLRRQ